jgi:hypothetical protein
VVVLGRAEILVADAATEGGLLRHRHRGKRHDTAEAESVLWPGGCKGQLASWRELGRVVCVCDVKLEKCFPRRVDARSGVREGGRGGRARSRYARA